MRDLAVAKIGGSILRNAQGMIDALAVLKHYSQIKVVVVSATFNTTNELEEIARESVSGNEQILEGLFKRLLEKHLVYVSQLDLPSSVENSIKSLLRYAREISIEIKSEGTISPQKMDSLYSVGELLSSRIFTSFLEKGLSSRKIQYLDARLVIKTDSNFKNANPFRGEIKKAVEKEICPNLDENSLFVIPGFIGSSEKGETTTLGREGSDYSAALLAEALEAAELQIWKDVPGIFTGDPKLIKNAKAVLEISFNEVNKFSEKGAKVLFPSALRPVMERNIPVFVGWIADHKKGTKIFKEKSFSSKLIGITNQSDFTRFELEKKSENITADNFMKNIKTILDIENVGKKAIFHDGEKISFHILTKEGMGPNVLNQLEEFSIVSKFPNISLISVVGVEMERFTERILQIVQELEGEGVSLILAEQTSDFLTFSFPSRSEKKVLNEIHDKLFL